MLDLLLLVDASAATLPCDLSLLGADAATGADSFMSSSEVRADASLLFISGTEGLEVGPPPPPRFVSIESDTVSIKSTAESNIGGSFPGIWKTDLDTGWPPPPR
ncbi:hypothetical protein V8J88_12085 [Massilia sp. W12]|uniref:hypothetical protein n=1 Tax=Massilia sp. W12 TaxID=3126507 RepID=UPI0030CAF062